ncbi:MAG: UDP-N-acetylmuramate--L-alanine ligase [Prevotella sp.]|nr:UDP-N-acetylmuramate--L-alanine ligase [Bacteroides sp.]MCM1366245.1 UDP-N-acetylmuramate--L-alanine ligase [Prevotella sp.]MCM1436350.1 UDP-N-acetylmuramate--L-alanine ligase [Prevotella sp.]
MKNIYFVGAGGIGMANLERYFLSKNLFIAGYDRTPSALTDALSAEGVKIVFEDDENLIPLPCRNPQDTLVVYTPAIPDNNKILSWFRNNGFEVIKRAALLGKITRQSDSICVAGSHGKTTTSSMIAHILDISKTGCNAFLGGILRNNNSNLILSDKSNWSVIEADEYDRSFHHLSPLVAIVTSTDPDHLDIYGDEAHYLEAFSIFTSLIRPGGLLLMHTGLKMKPDTGNDVTILSYSAHDGGDSHAENIRYNEGHLTFSYVGPDIRIDDIELGQPIEINIDNAVAAIAASLFAGASADDVKKGLATFLGAKRRFEFHLRDEIHPILLDDYAHSPNEVKASIQSVRKLFPGRKLTVIFQPHLYTRTRDFADEFAQALSEADNVIMPEIYPARELPIPGVTTDIILSKVNSPQKAFCPRKDLLTLIKNSNFDILMTFGAADIDRLLPDIKDILLEKRAQ